MSEKLKMMTRFDDLGKLFSMEIYGREAPWWGEYMAQYREAAKFARGAAVLDVGCGRGFGSRDLFDLGAIEVLGIDVNETEITIAREKNGRDGVDFKVMNANETQSLSKKFDLITCFQVLEKVSAPDGLIQNFARLLNSKGIAIISTVNRSRYSKLHEAPADPTHFIEFNLEEFTKLLKRNFSSIDVTGLVCTREDSSSAFLNPITDRIPFSLKDTVYQKVMGQTYFPTESDYVLTKEAVKSAHLFYAICKKA